MVRTAVTCVLTATLCASMAYGQQESKPNKAFIIGIGNYQVERLVLDFVEEDIAALKQALSTRCGFEIRDVYDTVVRSWTAPQTPGLSHRDALMKELERWASQMEESDTAVLYFSGHGFIGPDGKLYLALLDADPTAPRTGSLAASWLRELLEKCAAGKKLLLLDACHSAGAKSTSPVLASAVDIANAFEDTDGVVTFASCREEQSSYIWNNKRQSLYTYWLCKGLAGEADRDIDGTVTLRELERFVRPNVELTADLDLGRQQTPQLLGEEKLVDSIKATPFAMSWDVLLNEMVDCIDTTVRLRDLKCIGVCDVTCGDSGRNLGLEHGLLPSTAALMLCKRLIERAEDDYTVFSPDVMRDVLQEVDAQAGSLASVAVRGLEVNGIPIDAVVDGTILSRHKYLARLRANLLNCKISPKRRMTQYVTTGGFAYLSPTEWLDLGISADLSTVAEDPSAPNDAVNSNAVERQPDDAEPDEGTAPEVPMPSVPPTAHAHAAVQTFEELQAGALGQRHPLDPAAVRRSAFDVDVEVRDSRGRYTSCQKAFADGKCIVTFKKGDVYRIRLQNHHADRSGVFARVLVDGLNTLPEPVRAKGVTVSLREAAGRELQVAPPVMLREARPWFVRAGFDGYISGYLDGNWEVEKGHYEFRVVDAANSVAARNKYSDNIGLITVAFYQLAHTRSGPPADAPAGTAFGQFVERTYQRYTGNGAPGDELAVIHIHYVME